MEMKISFSGNFKVNAEFKGFNLPTDQPVSAGGEGTAPSPFDYFLVSLGTCAGFFVAAFCKQRSIPMEGIELTQNTEKDTTTHLISKVNINIRVPASFPEKYLDSLIKAAAQCTVKRHLENPPKIEVKTTIN